MTKRTDAGTPPISSAHERQTPEPSKSNEENAGQTEDGVMSSNEPFEDTNNE